MNRLTLVLTVLTAGSACITEESLGDTETDSDGGSGSASGGATAMSASVSTTNGTTETDGTDGTTVGDTDGLSMTATMASDPSSGPTEPTDDGPGPGTDPMTEGSGTAGVAMCPDWTPPPEACEPSEGAAADVQGDVLPELVDEPCQIADITNVDVTTDIVTLDCGDLYAIQITTANPHLDLPFSISDDVIVDATETFEPAVFGLPSFTIGAPGGALLLAWVNEIDHELDVDIAPVEFVIDETGCEGSSVGEECSGDGEIVDQRVVLTFGDAPGVFDGQQAIVSAAATDMSVIVDRATRIVCWDDDCAGDDSGPFDDLRLMLVALPGG